MSILTIFGALVLLSVLVFVHELGHFLAARRNGVKVETFAVGFGPSIYEKKVGDTVYALKLLPLGGYVKLFGEDATDPAIIKNKHSFASKSPRQRFEIAVAGVVFNVILALVLLTFGFIFGLRPDSAELMNEARFQAKLLNGELKQSEYLLVKKAKDPLYEGAKLIEVNGERAWNFNANEMFGLLSGEVKGESILRFVSVDNRDLLLKLSEGQAISDYGIELQLAYPIYKPKVYRESDLARFDLEKGDVIFAINDLPLVDKKHFESYLLEPNLNSLTVWRDGNGLKLDLARGDSKLLIADVVPDLPAAMVGIDPGDTLVSINGKVFAEASLATKFLREASLPIVLKTIDSDGKANNLTITKRSEDGLVGLYLTELTQVNAIADQLLFEPYLVSIVPESESLWRRVLLAPVRSLTEAYEVFKSSSVGFLSVLGRIVSFRELPETVGGPVAVTQVTSQFLQTDLAGTIWLMAILSLSLAAVNILPLPALDGGRIFFIILEVLRSGKAVPAKFEAITHLLGFLLLMLLIVLITFKDLARIF